MKSKCALIALFLHTHSLMAISPQWTGMMDGVWTEAMNWSPSTLPPVMAGDTANLTNASPTTTTITLSPMALTVNLQILNIDIATGYTISPGAGPGSFNFAGGPSQINVTTANGNSTNSISADIALSQPLTIAQGSTSALTLSGLISGSQTITFASTGTTVFSGSNSPGYTGQITINAGTLSISNDNNLGDASKMLTIGNGILLNTASITPSRPISLTGSTGGFQTTAATVNTASGVISGAGALNIAGAGRVVLTGANTYQSGTVISAGVLEVANDGNLGNSTGTLTIGNATLETTTTFSSNRSGNFTGTATIGPSVGTTLTLNGSFGGTGSLTLVPDGASLVLTGNNSYTGGTAIGAGFQLSGTTNGLQGNIELSTATSHLTFSQNFDGTFGGVITGLAGSTLTKVGSGNVTFTNNSSSFPGSTSITAGTLTVNGSLASSPVDIGSSSTLAGTGTVGATTSTSGIIAPGSGATIGTLSINGTLMLDAGSNVNINIAPTSADAIAASGAATLNGSLTVDPTPGFYGFSAHYTILTSSGNAGTFFPVTTTNSAFAPTVTVGATTVTLDIVISEPFALFPFSNFNTAAVGNNIDAIYAAHQLSPDLFDVFNTFVGESFDEINAALDQMHPAPYSAFTEMQTELSGQLLSLFHRLPYLTCSCNSPSRLWVEPFGNSLTMKRHGLEIGFQANSAGIAFGYDGEINDHLILGLGGAYNNSKLEWHDHYGHGSVNGLYGGIYFDSQFDHFYLGGTVLAGTDFYETSRHLNFSTIDRHAEADFKALDIMAQLSTAWLFGAPQAYFYPYANLDYLYLHTHKFSEHGAQGLDLKVQPRTDATLRTELGLGLQVSDTNAAETMCISPLISFGWVSMVPLQRPLLKATFEGASIPFSVIGWDETWNLLNVNFGLTISYLCFSTSLQYNAEMSGDSHTLLFNQHGGLRINWKW